MDEITISEQETKTKELESRVRDYILKNKSSSICSREEGCYFLVEKFLKGESTNYIETYRRVVCNGYPEICELNFKQIKINQNG